MSSKQTEAYGLTQTKADPDALSAKLFAALRQLRSLLVKEEENEEIMPYHTFSIATLQQICMKIPRKKEDLQGIPGIGEFKLSKYGDRIVETIESTICEHNNLKRHNTTSNENNNSSQRTSSSLNVSAKSSKDEDKINKNTRRSNKRATSARMSDDLARSSDLAEAGSKQQRLEDPSPKKSTVSNKRARIEATKCFALYTYHAGNLLASHEDLEKANTSLEARIEELSQENNELSQSTNKLKGEIENLKLALHKKDALLAEMRRDSEEREQELMNQLREAEEARIKNMAVATENWKREFLDRVTHMARDL